MEYRTEIGLGDGSVEFAREQNEMTVKVQSALSAMESADETKEIIEK